MCYGLGVARSLHVRLDDASAAALEIVRAGELSDSEAVRMLAADGRDREEMRIIREQLAGLAPRSAD